VQIHEFLIFLSKKKLPRRDGEKKGCRCRAAMDISAMMPRGSVAMQKITIRHC
jgi:hypothetical protein